MNKSSIVAPVNVTNKEKNEAEEEPGTKACVDLEGRFALRIYLDQDTYKLHENLLNDFANPDSKILDIRAQLAYFEEEDDDDEIFEFRHMPPELLQIFEDGVEFSADSIPEILRDYDSNFDMSLYDFFKKMLVCERQKRANPDNWWFGGPDVHHIYYEGGPPDECIFGS